MVLVEPTKGCVVADKEINVFVPFFRTDEILAEMRECLDIGWTGMGFKTLEFEDQWCQAMGIESAHFVNSATAALRLALEVFKRTDGWREGDEIISTPLTFVSTNHEILHAGLKPVFADVDEFLCLDPESIANAITPRTRAVMFVGFGGSPGRLIEVAELCKHKGLRLILDAAHMAGTRIEGADPSLWADAACYSFQAVKNLPTADSGMVCFREHENDSIARKLSWLGIDKDTFARTKAGAYAWEYTVNDVGFKYHGNSIVAVMGIVGLRYLERDNERRREISRIYEDELADCEHLRLVPSPANAELSRHLFQVQTNERTSLIKHLRNDGIFPGVHYKSNTEYPMYANLKGSTPKAETASQELVSLPLHLKLSEEDVQRVISSLVNFDLSQRRP